MIALNSKEAKNPHQNKRAKCLTAPHTHIPQFDNLRDSHWGNQDIK